MKDPKIKGLDVPPGTLKYAVLLFGGGDLSIVLVDEQTWESWSEEEDAVQFTDNIPSRLKVDFTNLHDMVNFCRKYDIELQDSVSDYQY